MTLLNPCSLQNLPTIRIYAIVWTSKNEKTKKWYQVMDCILTLVRSWFNFNATITQPHLILHCWIWRECLVVWRHSIYIFVLVTKTLICLNPHLIYPSPTRFVRDGRLSSWWYLGGERARRGRRWKLQRHQGEWANEKSNPRLSYVT